jgi:hypothetical protein
VRMRLVEADGHNHGGLLLNRPTALGGRSSNVCLDRVSDICILCAARSFVDTLQVFVCLADAGAQPAERVFDQINLTIFALRMTFVVAFAEVELRRGGIDTVAATTIPTVLPLRLHATLNAKYSHESQSVFRILLKMSCHSECPLWPESTTSPVD